MPSDDRIDPYGIVSDPVGHHRDKQFSRAG
jgi:hypothetical protein